MNTQAKQSSALTSNTYIRMLVFNPTQHVVWVSQEAYPPQNILRRIPITIPDLDFKIYHGPRPTIEWYTEFLKYNLVKPDGIENLDTAPVPTEFVDRVRLLRAQAYALNAVWRTTAGQIEKLDLVDNPLLSEFVDDADFIDVYKKIYKINDTSAKKLLAFKKDELHSRIRNLKLVELEAEVQIPELATVQQVDEYYKKLMMRLISIQPLNLSVVVDHK